MALHPWKLTPAEAVALQRRLASRVNARQPFPVRLPALVAGVDVSFNRGSPLLYAAVVVVRLPEFAVVEVRTARQRVAFPYVPGLLSFRELPPILAALARLKSSPKVVLCDGQGLAHPRRLGLACHLGLWLNLPTIGCGKSRLIGEFEQVGAPPGSQADLYDRGERLGAVVRTKARAKPLFISAGHRMDLASAVAWTLASCRGRRLPEPIRLAHEAVNQRRRADNPT